MPRNESNFIGNGFVSASPFEASRALLVFGKSLGHLGGLALDARSLTLLP
jgi:hypothetical protein